MQVAMEDFVKDPEKYVNMAKDNDIMLSRNGQDVARLTNVETPRMRAVRNLLNLKGILPANMDADAIREERLLKKYGPFE